MNAAQGLGRVVGRVGIDVVHPEKKGLMAVALDEGPRVVVQIAGRVVRPDLGKCGAPGLHQGPQKG